MTQAFRLMGVVSLLVLLTYLGLGYEAAYEISYGAFTLMAAMVSLTFLWLWMQRATPLAVGMAFSWAGAACVMGWWWVYNLMERPGPMHESAVLLLLLGVYFVGVMMHFAVIGRSLGLAQRLWGMPVALALVVSTVLHLLMS